MVVDNGCVVVIEEIKGLVMERVGDDGLAMFGEVVSGCGDEEDL